MPFWVFVKISSLAPIHSLKQEQIHTSIISTGLITLFYKLHKKCCRFELLHLKERFVAVVRGSKTHCILFTLNLTYSPQMSDNRSHSHPSTNLALLLYLQWSNKGGASLWTLYQTTQYLARQKGGNSPQRRHMNHPHHSLMTTLTTMSTCSTLPHIIHIMHIHIAASTIIKSSTHLSPNTDLTMTTTILWCGLTTFLQVSSYNKPKLHPTFLLPYLYIANTQKPLWRLLRLQTQITTLSSFSI